MQGPLLKPADAGSRGQTGQERDGADDLDREFVSIDRGVRSPRALDDDPVSGDQK